MMDERALTYCEIDFSPCVRNYGLAPCVAAVGVTGDIKCFNTRFTCQDPDNFSAGLFTQRFAIDAAYLPVEIPAITSLLAVDFTPGRLSLGKDLGQRPTIKFVFKDHPWGDTGPGYDPYVTERPYNPSEQGSYWGKLRARWLTLQGRAIRLITGFVGQTLEEMETRHFVIDSIEGPTPDGTFIVVAQDILKLADGEKSLTPPLSSGFLQAAINNSQTNATLAPSGVGAEYPLSGHVTIGGKEVCAYTRVGDALTLQRAQKGTAAVAHSQEDRVQVMRSYVAQKPSQIFSSLFQDDSKIDASWIPLSEWQQEEDTKLQLTYTRDIAEPTATAKIAAELIEQAGLVVFSDPLARKIRMLVLSGVPSTATVVSPDTIVENSLKVREQPSARISQVHVRYGLSNPLLRSDDRLSYRSVLKGVDGPSSVYWATDEVREVNGTFLPPFAVTTAKRTSDILLSRHTVPPRVFSFLLSRRGPILPKEGQTMRLAWPGVTQHPTGETIDTPIQVVRLNPIGRRIEVEAEEQRAKATNPEDLKNRVLLIKSNEWGIDIPTLHAAAYPPLTLDDVANGVNLQIIVDAGITIGSYLATAAGFALRIGATGTNWPPGFLIKLIIAGYLRGKGGDAGRGADYNANNFTAGQQGGTALHTRHPTTVELLSGAQIRAGGGGGGGGGRIIYNLYGRLAYAPGGGGGGGAGINAGAGGWRGAGFQNGIVGGDGSAESAGYGGLGGRGEINGSLYNPRGGTGGNGGAPGAAGANGGALGGAGGAAGIAIDGISYCTFAINAGTRAGQEVN